MTHTGKLVRGMQKQPHWVEFIQSILLHHEQSRAKVSWEDVRKVSGIQYDTFQATCRHLGLLHDDAECNTVLEDAALISMCQQMRELLVTLLLFCNLAEPAVLFEQHNPQMGDDFICRIQAGGGAEPTDAELCTMVSIDIEQCLQSVGRQLRDFYLPSIDPPMRDRVSQLDAHMRLGQLPRELREEFLCDTEVEQEKADEWMGMLLDSQRTMVEAVLHAVRHSLHFSAFFDTLGGTGKTFCFNLLLAAVRAQGQIALMVASIGIAATLLNWRLHISLLLQGTIAT